MMPSSRRGIAPGDVLLGLSGLALMAALTYPRVERALMLRTADAVQADVETVQAAAAAHLAESGAWPASAEPGTVPVELTGRIPPGFSFQGEDYTLEWDRWQTVEDVAPTVVELPPEEYESSVPPTPTDSVPDLEIPVETLGAVTVHSSDDRILAALLERFGASRSFVLDRTWTLVLPPPPAAASPERTR